MRPHAHNTLTDNDGNALLSDFRVATIFDRTDNALALTLGCTEVSTFGYVLDDLLSLCNEACLPDALKKLALLRDVCISEDVQSRPVF